MKYLSTISKTTLAALTLSVFIFHSASAATTPAQTSGQALELAPPLVTLKANPGQKVTAQISLRDVSPTSLRVTNQIDDFTAAGEDGTPKLLLDETEPVPYSLKKWIAPIAPLTLKSREIKNIAVTINVPANASPGGYYGVIRFSGAPPELENSGVSLSASLGALVFLRVNGQANEKLSIADFYAQKESKKGSLFEAAPITFVQRLKNEGNVFEQPTGQVTIKDMFGNQLATLAINQPPRNILPSSTRKFETALDSTNIGDKFLFGKYTAELQVHYGENPQTVTKKISFWVIPYKLIFAIIIGLIILFIGFRALIRRYNKYIIKQARRR